MSEPELSGLAIVGAGTFNPAIVHPRWLADKQLLPQGAAEHAMEQDHPQPLIVSPQFTAFVADWLTVQITQAQAVFSTVDQGRELDLRDFVRGVFQLLPETPVDAIGLNLDQHFRTESEGAWHAFGDKFLPKDFWEPLFDDDTWAQREDGKRVGMRVMTVEVNRDDPDLPGHVRVELAPSVRVTPYGVYTGINAHFQLTKPSANRGTAADASQILLQQWDRTRALEARLAKQLAEVL